MRKIFILGGSTLQLDLILEAKKMFFYTIVIDMDKNCIGSKWCDKFLNIDIAEKELILEKAKLFNIDLILTSSTELGNLTACWVGEKLRLNTNLYQTALNTTNKLLMKKIFNKNNILTAKYKKISSVHDLKEWNIFPCIMKPSDSSAGKGLSYIVTKEELNKYYFKAMKYSKNSHIIVEEYIEGKQYSVETISTNKKHQLLTINREKINNLPNIMERSHTIPANINSTTINKITDLTIKILNIFNIKFGASHIEFRISDGNIYIIEIASRTGGMRTEMINFAYGVSYSQLLILSSLNTLSTVNMHLRKKVTCNFIINYKEYKKYKELKTDTKNNIFEPFNINKVSKKFVAENIAESKGYYFIIKEFS